MLWSGLETVLLRLCQRCKEIDLLKNEERRVLPLARPDIILHPQSFWQGERLPQVPPAWSC